MALLTYKADLSNPGFESGDFTGWVANGSWEIRTGYFSVSAYEGAYAAFGAGASGEESLYRDVDVSGAATTIDNNSVSVECSAARTNDLNDVDYANFRLVCLDGSNNELDFVETGFVVYPDNNWVVETLSLTAPTGTRAIRAECVLGSYGGSNNQSGIDDVQLFASEDIWPSTVTNAAVVTQEAVELLYYPGPKVTVTHESVEVLHEIKRIPFTATTSLGTATTTGLSASLVRAPTLHGVGVHSISSNTADWKARSNRAGGTIYYVVTNSPTQPTPEQVVDGLDHEDNMAADSGSKNV